MWRFGNRSREILAAATATLVAVAGFDFFAELPALRNAELLSLDLRFQLRGPLPAGPETVLILVDEPSIAALGRPPFSRAVFAEAIRRLSEAGARVIAMDLLFSEAERALPDPLRAAAERLLSQPESTRAEGLNAAVAQLLAAADPDQALGEAVAAAGNVVVPFAFTFRGARDPMPALVRPHSYRQVFASSGMDEDEALPHPRGALTPIGAVAHGAAAIPAVNVLYDTNGALTYEYPAFAYGNAVYPSLPVSVLRLWHGLSHDDLALELGRGLRLGPYWLPTDESTRFVVNYRGPQGSFPAYSLGDLVAGRIPSERIAGRIVLIGVSAVGFADTIRTPFEAALPRVERYANIIDMFLRGDLIARDETINRFELFLMTAIGLGAGLAAAYLSAVPAAAAALAGGAGVIAGAHLAFTLGGMWLHVVGPLSMIALNFTLVTVVRLLREERLRRNIERALRVSEERYALAARGANDGLWDWDLVTNRVYYSARWRGMMDIGPEEVGTPATWFGRVHPDDATLVRHRLNRHLDNKSRRFRAEFRVRRPNDGPFLWVLARGLAIRDGAGKAVRIAGSFTDITDRIKAEEQLRAATLRAESANHTKTEFLARMSHELRTPLNAIIGFSEILYRQMFGPIGSDVYRGYAQDIHTSGTHLLSLISDILDVTQIEAGRIDLQSRPFDLAAALRSCIDMIRGAAERGGLTLDCAIPASVDCDGDEVKLKQVFINLLSNAVKFSHAGGIVGVSVDRNTLGSLSITVRDRGIGIAATDIDRVTKPFVQGTGIAAGAFGGTGLGLSIAKALVELHGGTLNIDSRLGQGTAVTVRLPSRAMARSARTA